MFNSRNFFTTLLSLVLATAQLLGVNLGTTGDELIGTFASGNISLILMAIVNLYNPVRKIIQGQLWKTFDFLKSRNFWANISTFVISTVAMLTESVIPESGAGDIADAVVSGNVIEIIIAVLVNIVNFVHHDVEPKVIQMVPRAQSKAAA